MFISKRILILLFMIGCFYSFNSVLARDNSERLTDQQIVNGNVTLKTSSYIDSIGESVVKTACGQFDETKKFIIVESDAVKILTVPSGTIFISRGLLNMLSDEGELAAALAYGLGMSGVTGTSSADSKIDYYALKRLAEMKNNIDYADIPGLSYRIDPQTKKSVPQAVKQEHDSDKAFNVDLFSFITVVKMGYNPQSVISYLTKINNYKASNPGLVHETFSGSPSLNQRIERIKGFLNSSEYNYTWDPARDALYKERYEKNIGIQGKEN